MSAVRALWNLTGRGPLRAAVVGGKVFENRFPTFQLSIVPSSDALNLIQSLVEDL